MYQYFNLWPQDYIIFLERLDIAKQQVSVYSMMNCTHKSKVVQLFSTKECEQNISKMLDSKTFPPVPIYLQ